VAATCENGINNNTGIKQGPLNGKSQPITNRGKVDKLKSTNVNAKRIRKSSKAARKSMKTSQNVVVESISIITRSAPESNLDTSIFYVPPLSPLNHLENENFQNLSRDERLHQRKVQLRRRVQQFKGIQRYRTTEQSKRRFSKTLKLLKQLDCAKDEM
jgi:hypothetical protein